MAEKEMAQLQISPDGIKGLAMMVPIVGLPLLPILGGVALAGIGYLAVSGHGMKDLFRSLGIALPDAAAPPTGGNDVRPEPLEAVGTENAGVAPILS